ncbi:hypothetical protein KIPB_013245, partial [Kipferlia bialata]|eukprot:g13245.t1
MAPLYELRPVEGRDMGVFALQDLERGQCILRETPAIPMGDRRPFTHDMVEGLSEEQRAEFWSLDTQTEGEGEGERGQRILDTY